VRFSQGKPFRPFEQLMGVMPAASSGLLPPAYQPLMLETTSPVIDFYPDDFKARKQIRCCFLL
jgi:5'-3' exonuclease